MEAHQQRVVEEKKKLDERTEKLGEFLSTPLFESLEDDEQVDMSRQYFLMDLLSVTLGRRIARF